MIEALAERGLHCLALDTPGNGLSDPLPGWPSTEDYAEALANTLNSLGVTGRFGIYGFHTGAGIAVAFAAANPDRITHVVADGYAVWTEAERKDLLSKYLPERPIQADGTHMIWAWGRLEDQTIFFPWYDQTPAGRMTYDIPPAAAIHSNLIDLLENWDAYRPPYAAAFERRGAAALQGWRGDPKVAILAHARDPLAAHLGRVPSADGVTVLDAFDDREAMIRTITDLMRSNPGDPIAGLTVSSPTPAAPWRDVRRGVHRTGFPATSAGRSTLFLHAPGSSLRIFDAERQALDEDGVGSVAIDLPGHGDSDARQTETLDDLIACVVDALGGLGPFDRVVTDGVADVIGAALVARGIADRMDAMRTNERGALPDLTPTWDGAHVQRAWRLARRQALFQDWWAPHPVLAADRPDWLEAPALQRRAQDLLKSAAQGRRIADLLRRAPQH